jgi:hypothetical protein
MQLTQCRNRTVREAAIRFDAWTTRRRTEFRALGHLLSFVLLFGGVAHATYHCRLARYVQASCGETCLAMPGFFLLASVACGAMAVLFMLAFAATLRALGREAPTLEGSTLLIVTGTILIHWGGLVGAKTLLKAELFFAWALAGLGVVDFFWSRFAAGRAENNSAG